MIAAGPGHAAERKAAREDFPERRDVRHHAVVLLRPAVREAEARHDLVEDERNAVPPRDVAQPLRNCAVGHDDALIRLEDDGGEIVVIRGDQRFGRREVVVRSDQHRFFDRVRNAARVAHRGAETPWACEA